MDARLTRIQQRYLLSERASNCSSSNTPEVKLKQRKRLQQKTEGKMDDANDSLSPQTRQDEERQYTKITSPSVADDGIRDGTQESRKAMTGKGRDDFSSHSIKLNKSPIILVHKVQTPPSVGPTDLLNRLIEKQTAQMEDTKPETEKPPCVVSPQHEAPLGSGAPDAISKLRRSPRKPKPRPLVDKTTVSEMEKKKKQAVKSYKKVRWS